MVESATTDGRLGTIKTFVARGKVRAKLFVAAATPPLTLEIDEQPISGPNANSLDAPGATKDECTYEGVTGECATEQEIEDALWVIAGLEAENEYQMGVYETTTAEIDYFCSQNPWACEELPDGQQVISGPNACTDAFASCASKGWIAFGTTVAAIGSAAGATIMAASIVAPPAGLLAATVTVAVGTTVASIATVYEYVDCKMTLWYSGPSYLPIDVFEPVY